jgi:hypothetical protein
MPLQLRSNGHHVGCRVWYMCVRCESASVTRAPMVTMESSRMVAPARNARDHAAGGHHSLTDTLAGVITAALGGAPGLVRA